MKKIASFALAFVLTTAMLVGCGCTNQNMDNTSAPTVLPTNEEIWDSTEASTRATTEATTATAATTEETMDRGNGPLEDTTGTTDATGTTESTAEGRTRGIMPNMR